MAKRRFLDAKSTKEMIESWDSKTINELAEKFDVSVNTIILMAKEVNQLNNKKCKPKKRIRKTRKSIAEEALKMLK